MSEPVPFVASQVSAVIEGIRLLESFVTAPLGLHSDIKMLRESLPFPEAGDLSRDEQQERRSALATLADAPLEMALDTVGTIVAILDTLGSTRSNGGSPLDPSWVSQARRVLARAGQRVAIDIRAQVAARVRGLYVIVDPEATRGRPVLDVAEATLEGGAGVLQLRDKMGDKGDVLAVARKLKAMCDEAHALFVVNDDADVALACEAHALHVGQTDLPVAEARKVLAPHQMVGRSNNGVEEAMESQAQAADYLAVGAIFPTTTMGKSGRNSVGVEMIGKVKEAASQPVVAIGGINAGNISDVVRAGADCVCVVSAVTYADDPAAATRELVEAIQDAQ